MTPHGLLLILACVVIETLEQTLFRSAGKRPERYFFFVTPAVLLHVLGLACWFMVLRLIPLGVALPLMGLNYVAIAIASRYLFREPVDARRWTGIALIIAGFTLVATYHA